MKRMPPDCQFGYTEDQIVKIMGDRLGEFYDWMRGQTQALCDTRIYDHEAREYQPSGCPEAHGVVTYPQDVQQFISGGQPLD